MVWGGKCYQIGKNKKFTYHDGFVTVVELRFSLLHVFMVILNNRRDHLHGSFVLW